MSISIQTNVNSLIAQQNLNVNSAFQSKTIEQLTSGYRINSSGDDAAGLAVANKYRSDIAELSQGVLNANDGISQLQIIDGGMNNISQMLDRLKTLASQSASDTFSGDRSVVNSEFQTLLGEIDRQAQAIGLDQNGQFAKTLAVFVGGGRAHGTGAISTANGTVNIGLTDSVVDTRSLGLTGMQAVAGAADLSNSSKTSVANVVADTTNKSSESTPGSTIFYVSGSGFSDSSKIAVSVNLGGVTDTDTLVAAINAGIQNAGNGTTAAATAFKNAGIVASVNTDVSGGQQLAFTSSTSAFQVQAADRMSNALMGNFSSGTTGASMATTVTGQAADATTTDPMTANDVLVKISGAGMATPVTVTLSKTGATVGSMITSLETQVAADAGLKAAGISVTQNSNTGQIVFTNSRNEQFSVEVSGDSGNKLGLGAWDAGSSITDTDNTSITAGATYAASNAVTNAAVGGEASFQFSINGQAPIGIAGISLAGGDATQANVALAAINTPVQITTGTNDVLNLDVDGTTVTTTLAAAGSSGAATGGTFVAANNATDVNLSTGNNTFLLNVDNQGPKVVTLAANQATTTALSSDLFAQNASAVLLSSANDTFKLQTASAGSGTVVTLADNQAAATGGHVFVAPNNATDIDIAAGASTFNIDLGGGHTGTIDVGSSHGAEASTVAFAAPGVSDVTISSGNDTFKVNVDGGGATTVTLADGTYNATTIVGAVNQALQTASLGAGASLDQSGHLVISSNTIGTTSTVAITADVGTALTDLGLAADGTHTGLAALNLSNVANRVNAGLTTAGLNTDGVASVDAAGHLVIKSTAATGAASQVTLSMDGTSSALHDLGLSEGTSNGLSGYDSTNIVSRMQAAIDTAGLAATASLDTAGNLQITSNAVGAVNNSYIKVTQNNASTALTQLGITSGVGTLAAGYNKANVASALNTAFTTAGIAGVTASVDATTGVLSITSNTNGTNSVISLGQDGTSTALGDLGLTAGTNVGLAGADASTIAGEIQAAITAAKSATGGAGGTNGVLYGTGKSATVTVGAGNHILITNDSAGASHTIANLTGNAVTAGAGNWAKVAGRVSTLGTNRSGADMATAINQELWANADLLNAGLTASYSAGSGKLTIASNNATAFRMNAGSAPTKGTVTGTLDLTSGADFTGAPETLQVSVDGGATQTVNLTGKYSTAAQLAAAITLTGAAASVVAVNGKEYLQIASTNATPGPGASVQILSTGTANAALGLTDTTVHKGSNEVDLGFGTSDVSDAGSLAVASAASALSVVNAGGTSQTGPLTFADLVTGTQALTISANNSEGAMQSATITLAATGSGTTALANNGSGDNIDQAVAYINSQLQSTNNATLQSIVAVKQTVNGSEEINLISSLSNFQVGIGTSTNAKQGVNGGVAENANAVVNGTGSTVSVASQANAMTAVSAIAAAVTKLGAAQAAVGRGQNQLNYAQTLAQSQISSFSAAQSRIRDADVAAEAANLTKAQVLQQASIAAMAQANSAPQAVLALLRG
jgi:flagellin